MEPRTPGYRRKTTNQVRSNLETRARSVRELIQSLHGDLGSDCWSWIAGPKMLLSSLHSSVKQILSYKLEKILVLSLTAVLLAILPFVLFLIACMFVIRHAVSILAKHFRPDLGTIIPTRSAGFATDLVYNKIPKYSVVVPLYVKGHLGVGDLRARLREVLDKKDAIKEPRAGTSTNPEDLDTISALRYPELKQFVYSWFGILFWRWEQNFKIEDHVNLLNDRRYVANSGTTLNEEDLARIGQDFTTKPYRKGRSHWEILLQHHTCTVTGEPRTLVIFRIHHALGDGFSILKFCLGDLSQQSNLQVQETKTRYPEVVPWPSERESAEGFLRTFQRELTGIKIYKMATFTIMAMYDFASAVINTWDFNSWKLPERKLRHRMKLGVTEPIPLTNLKRIKNQNQIALTSLLLAAYAGALRNYMEERNRSRHSQIPIPDHVHCMVTLPFPGHSGRLTNHMTGTFVKLPLNLQSSPRARLLAISRELEAAKRSTFPTLIFYGIQVSGIAPAPITWLYFGNIAHSCALSNFPGPEHPVNFVGHEILDGSFTARVGNMPFVFTALSYNGNIRLAFGLDEAITVGGNDGELGSKMMQELQSLDKNLEIGSQ